MSVVYEGLKKRGFITDHSMDIVDMAIRPVVSNLTFIEIVTSLIPKG
jgi:hypothetical protein